MNNNGIILREFRDVKKSYTLVFKNAFKFGGRTSRKEYWYGIISHYLLLIALVLIVAPILGSTTNSILRICFSIISVAYIIPMLIGLLSIYYRRMRDIGKKSLFSFILQICSAIPFLGIIFGIWTFVLLCFPSFDTKTNSDSFGEGVESYFLTWKNSFNYSGISKRKEFWIFVIASTIIAFPLSLFVEFTSNLFVILGNEQSISSLKFIAGLLDFIGYFYFWGSYVVFCSLSVRRLRDLGKSPYWLFLMIIPIINLIPMFLWCTKTSLREEIQ